MGRGRARGGWCWARPAPRSAVPLNRWSKGLLLPQLRHMLAHWAAVWESQHDHPHSCTAMALHPRSHTCHRHCPATADYLRTCVMSLNETTNTQLVRIASDPNALNQPDRVVLYRNSGTQIEQFRVVQMVGACPLCVVMQRDLGDDTVSRNTRPPDRDGCALLSDRLGSLAKLCLDALRRRCGRKQRPPGASGGRAGPCSCRAGSAFRAEPPCMALPPRAAQPCAMQTAGAGRGGLHCHARRHGWHEPLCARPAVAHDGEPHLHCWQ